MRVDDQDRRRLERAVALAAKGRFAVEPNPLVGCVVVQGGAVVGEGWHGAWGGPHAEVAALAAAGDAARGATAYVSLEPCSRVGKTPACTEALLAAGIARVVYAAADPAEAGAGARALEAGGVRVDGPALPDEGDVVLAPYHAARARRRPWVALKWAMSADGAIAPRPGVGGAITSAAARAHAHRMRAHADAVLVGAGTVLADDPQLTVRLADGVPAGRPAPLRVVVDADLAVPPGSALARSAREVPVLVYGGLDRPDRRRALEGLGVQVVVLPGPEGAVDLAAALEDLAGRGVGRLLVEGGARVHGALLRADLADQVSAFVAPILLGGSEALGAVRGTGIEDVAQALRLREVRWRRLGDDLLLEGYVVSGRSAARS